MQILFKGFYKHPVLNCLNILSLIVLLGFCGILSKDLNAQVIVRLNYPDIDSLRYENVWNFQTINKTGNAIEVKAKARIKNQLDSILYEGESQEFMLFDNSKNYYFTESSFQIKETIRNEKILMNGQLDKGIYSFCIYIFLVRNSSCISRDCIRIVCKKE